MIHSLYRISQYRLVAFFLIIALCTPTSRTVTPNLMRQQTPVSPITPVDQLTEAGLKDLGQIAVILVTISGYVNSSQSTITNKKEVVDYLRGLTKLIQSLRKEKFATVNLETAYSLFQFNNLVMRHISDALTTNFVDIKEKNIDALLTNKAMPKNIDPTCVIRLVNENQLYLNMLMQQADSFGLRWYNRVYRVVDNWIIAPCQQYSIPRRALLLTATASLALISWRSFHFESYKENCPSFLKLVFGRTPVKFHGYEYSGGAERGVPPFGQRAWEAPV